MAQNVKAQYNRSYSNVLKQVANPPHHFALLGVTVTSTEGELRAARRALAGYLHPDVNADPKATALMASVNAAHAILQDKTLRRHYLATLPQEECKKCAGKGATTKQRGFLGVGKTVCIDCKGSGRQ